MVESKIAPKIDQLEKLYRIPEEGKVRLYLAARPELVDILLEARDHIEVQFGHDAAVELRFARGSDSDQEGELLAMIQSPLDADAALDGLDRLWDEWWGDASGRRASWPLYVGVEYGGECVE
jgi:hypothetical protein